MMFVRHENVFDHLESSRTKRKDIREKEIKEQIIAPFRKFVEKDDLLLTLKWSIPGGPKEYAKLLKKHGMASIVSEEEELEEIESYMIYNMKSREVKYDSLASELFRETTLKITPKKAHHSKLTIPLDEHPIPEP